MKTRASKVDWEKGAMWITLGLLGGALLVSLQARHDKREHKLARGLDAHLDDETAKAVDAALTHEKDPAMLKTFAAKLHAAGFTKTAQTVEARVSA